ncbi:6,7-dimethyl-8-ribityllumazine synthase [Puccinia sorghi]|uniref:6,7-dimethyl-8-ribityllumazine synthase n=1 Tax=Puccinia sorghi TaxID=27349 RepID=A0A0L6U9L2_9BASI|nr:6,7-dimethyl-8-ribityllumazine synthase [Puccinia sorghi]
MPSSIVFAEAKKPTGMPGRPHGCPPPESHPPGPGGVTQKMADNHVKQAPVTLGTLSHSNPDLSNLKILIIHTEWNKTIINNLLKFCVLTLKSMNLPPENILLQSVPGSYELPWACNSVLSNPSIHKDIDAIIAMGVLIKGDTMHFEYIAESVSKNLSDVSIKHNKPIIFGVLTCLTEDQARIRSGLLPADPSNHNHAIDWAKAAVDCALNSRRFSSALQNPPHLPFSSANDPSLNL